MHYEIVNETENVPAFIELESMLQSFDIIIVYIVYFFQLTPLDSISRDAIILCVKWQALQGI